MEDQQDFVFIQPQKPGLSKTRRIIIIVAAAMIVVAATVAAKFYFDNQVKPTVITNASGQESVVSMEEVKAALNVDTFYTGISVGGFDVSGKTKEEAKEYLLGEIEKTIPSIKLTFVVDSKNYELDPSVLTSESDLDTVLEEAFLYNRTNTQSDETTALLARYETLLALKVEKKDFPLSFSVGKDKLDEAITDLLSPLETESVDATAKEFDVEKLAFVITESVDGVSLNIDKAIKDAHKAIDANEVEKTIYVAADIAKPAVTKEALTETLGLVSTFTTKTSDKPNRNVNIDLVCKMVDGLVLLPGESFSFNDFIGQRTAEKGFKEAPGIYNGAIRMELGGGICQTTGTLYHSVLMADLQVDVRKPHSWPSDYVDTGTDATVTWGGANFAFTNNSEYPIAIHAYYSDLHVTMEIYGRPVADGMTIDVVGDVTGRSAPAGPEYVADPALPVGKKTTERSAHDYISAVCYKVYYKDDVEVKREVASTSVYGSIRAKIHIGVLAPDGTICPMDPATGAVTLPTTPPTDPTLPTDTTAPTDSTGAPTDTTTAAPTETTTAAPTDTTTAAPTESSTAAP